VGRQAEKSTNDAAWGGWPWAAFVFWIDFYVRYLFSFIVGAFDCANLLTLNCAQIFLAKCQFSKDVPSIHSAH
jgi:hypothetical protein